MEYPSAPTPFDTLVLDEAEQDALADDLMAERQMNTAPAPFGVYAAVKAELIARGIPAEQIAFIQDYHTPAKRADLFVRMRRGDIRVLLCSKQSTGMNVQDRMIALHHLDAPWRPGDLEQRNGRIARQGNHWPEVYQYVYVTAGSFDGFIWQTLETKSRFINQMRAGDVSVRELDDVGEAVLSAAEIKALASGNPRIMQKVKLDSEVAKLHSLRAEWQENAVRMRKHLLHIAADRQALDERQVLLDAALAVVQQYNWGAPFTAAIPKSLLSEQAFAYTKRAAAGKALRALVGQACARAANERQMVKRTIGRYQGFVLRVHAFALGHAEVGIVLDQNGKLSAVSSKTVKIDTDESVFASIDAILRGLPDRRAGVDAERARLNDEEAKLTASLAARWGERDRYTTLKAELDAINAELAQDEQPCADDSAEAARTTTLTVVDEDDVAAAQGDVLLPWQIRPSLNIPRPANVQAMTEAVARLAQRAVVPVVEAEAIDQAEPIVPPNVVDAAPTTHMPPHTLVVSTPRTPTFVFGQAVPTTRRTVRKPSDSVPMQLALWELEAEYGTKDDGMFLERGVGQTIR